MTFDLVEIHTSPSCLATALTLPGSTHKPMCKLGHLEEGDPDALAGPYVDIRATHPKMNVFGGCCGTDFVHVEKIGRALLTAT